MKVHFCVLVACAIDSFSQPHVQNKMDCNCLDSSTAKCLHFRQHISQTCRCCFYHIPDLRHIRRHIYFALTKTIATALVRCRLDYSLNHNIALHDILKLQCLQIFLAKLSDLLVYLTQCNFLNNRIGSLSDIALFFKICTFTYQAFSSKQPAYLHSLFSSCNQIERLLDIDSV